MFGFILAFIAGFVDTATYVGARGVFSAHVTGNFVLFAVALVKGVHQTDYLKIFLFIPFLLTAAIVSRLSNVRKIMHQFESAMLFLAGFLLICSGSYFFGVTKLKDELWDISNVFIMFPVMAMAIQTGLYKIVSPAEPMTTVMSGNVTQLALEIVGFRGESGDRLSHLPKFYSILRVILGFALGCIAGALIVSNFSLGALILPGIFFLIMGFSKLKKQTASTS